MGRKIICQLCLSRICKNFFFFFKFFCKFFVCDGYAPPFSSEFQETEERRTGSAPLLPFLRSGLEK